MPVYFFASQSRQDIERDLFESMTRDGFTSVQDALTFMHDQGQFKLKVFKLDIKIEEVTREDRVGG